LPDRGSQGEGFSARHPLALPNADATLTMSKDGVASFSSNPMFNIATP
jgi:hypothetical protein